MLAKQSFPILEAQRRHSEKSILNSGLNNVQCRDKIVFAPLQGKIRRNYFYLPPAAGEMVGQCLNNFWLGRENFISHCMRCKLADGFKFQDQRKRLHQNLLDCVNRPG